MTDKHTVSSTDSLIKKDWMMTRIIAGMLSVFGIAGAFVVSIAMAVAGDTLEAVRANQIAIVKLSETASGYKELRAHVAANSLSITKLNSEVTGLQKDVERISK